MKQKFRFNPFLLFFPLSLSRLNPKVEKRFWLSQLNPNLQKLFWWWSKNNPNGWKLNQLNLTVRKKNAHRAGSIRICAWNILDWAAFGRWHLGLCWFNQNYSQKIGKIQLNSDVPANIGIGPTHCKLFVIMRFELSQSNVLSCQKTDYCRKASCRGSIQFLGIKMCFLRKSVLTLADWEVLSNWKVRRIKSNGMRDLRAIGCGSISQCATVLIWDIDTAFLTRPASF